MSRNNFEKSKNYCLIGAITATEIIGMNIFLGGMKGDDYFPFITELISKVRYPLDIDNCLFVADNAKIHKAKNFYNLFDPYVHFIFNVAYIPHFNVLLNFWDAKKIHERT